MKTVIPFLLIILLYACNNGKTYYYKDASTSYIKILAKNDTVAYKDAFKKFIVARKIYQDVSTSSDKSNLNDPVAFSLLDANMNDITNAIQFPGRKAFEDRTESSVMSMSSIVPQNDKTVQKISSQDTSQKFWSPVKVITSKFVRSKTSGLRNIQLSYRNVSDKTISNIKFRWFGVDVFDQPANMGGHSKGMGVGDVEQTINSGELIVNEWEISTNDAKRILTAYAYEVSFSDGTSWKWPE